MNAPSTKLPNNFHDGVADLLAAGGRSPAAAEALMALDSAVFAWYRTLTQGGLIAPVLRELATPIDMTQFRALTAVTRIRQGIGRAAPEPPTVGLMAEELGIDPSRASRIAADLIADGLLRREAAQDDGRKSVLALTDTAIAIFAEYRRRKWEKYREAFADWSDDDIESFARQFNRFFDSMAAVHGLPLAGRCPKT